MIRPRVGFRPHSDPQAQTIPNSTTQTHTSHSRNVGQDNAKRLMSDARVSDIMLTEAYVLGELGKPSKQGADMRDPGRSETHMIQPPTQAHMRQSSPEKGTATASDRLATYHTLNTPNAITQGATEAVLGWEPNKDPIGRLKALMDDKTWMPNVVDATHTSLYNLSDALRRWPRRADRHNKAEHRNHETETPKAQWNKPSSKTRRLTNFLNTQQGRERALLTQGASMIRCVEGAGTAESGVFDPLLPPNHG